MRGMDEVFEHLAKMRSEEAKPPALIAVALRDQAAFFDRPNPFKKGNLVTPRAGMDVKGAGNPHIVLYAAKDAEFSFSGNPASNSFGQLRDMRVLHWDNGHYFTHWVESAQFEAWVDPTEEAGETETAAAEAA